MKQQQVFDSLSSQSGSAILKHTKFRPKQQQPFKKLPQPTPISSDKIQHKWYSRIGFYGYQYLLACLIVINADLDLKHKIFSLFKDLIKPIPTEQQVAKQTTTNQNNTNQNKILQNEKGYGYQLIPHAKGKHQAIYFIRDKQCYFNILADIDNAEKLIEYLQSESIGECWRKIGTISLYMPKKNQTHTMRMIKLKQKYPYKIGGIVRNFNEYAQKIRPFVKSCQRFIQTNNGEIQLLNYPFLKNTHQSYAVVDGDITELNNHKLHLISCLKTINNPVSYEKRQPTPNKQSDQQFSKETQKYNKSQIELLSDQFLNYLKFLINAGSAGKLLQNRNEIIDTFKSIERKHGYLDIDNQQGPDKKSKDTAAMINIIIIICLLKAQSIYYYALNSILRIAQKLSDFNVVAIPFADTFTAIKNVYLKQIKLNNWIRPHKTLWRTVKLQDFQKLVNSKGKYCEFFGFSSFSENRKIAQSFIPKQNPEGYVLIKLTIPEFKYEINDSRLQNDYGFINVKQWIIKQNETLYAQTLQKLQKDKSKNQKIYIEEKERQFILNALNVYLFQGIVDNVYQFTYTTTHQIEARHQKQLQNSSEFATYINNVLEHYRVFNSKFNDSKNVSDIFAHLGYYDKAKYYMKSFIDPKSNSFNAQNICKYNQYCLKTGSKEGFTYTKQLARAYKFEVNASAKEKQLQSAIKASLSDQEDNIEVIKLLKRKLQIFEPQIPRDELQIAKVYWEIGQKYTADNRWRQAQEELNKSYDMLSKHEEEMISVVDMIGQKRSASTNTWCFSFFTPSQQQIKLQVQSIIENNRNFIQSIDIFIEVTYKLIECNKRMKDIFINYSSLIKDDEQKPNETQKFQSNFKDDEILKRKLLSLIQLRKNLDKNHQLPVIYKKYQFEIRRSLPSSNSQEIHQLYLSFVDLKLHNLKELQKSSKLTEQQYLEIVQLQEEKNNLAWQSIKQLQNAPPGAKYLINQSQIQIKIPQSIKKLRTKGINTCSKLFNYKVYKQEIDQTTRNIQQNIQLLAKIKGQTIEVIKKRSEFVQFLFDTHQISKSLEQSFKIINSTYGDTHSKGAQAFYSLARGYHEMGEQKKSFKSLTFAIQILQGAKIKEDKDNYKQVFYISETRLNIQMMKAKIFLAQTQEDLVLITLPCLNNIEQVIKNQICSTSLKLSVQISQTKGDFYAKNLSSNEQKMSISKTVSTTLSQSQKVYKFEDELKKSIIKASKQTGQKSLKVANIYCSMARYMLQEGNYEKANEYYNNSFEIVFNYGENSPQMWSCLLVKSKLKKIKAQELKEEQKKPENKKRDEQRDEQQRQIRMFKGKKNKKLGSVKEQEEAFEIGSHSLQLVNERYCKQMINYVRVSYDYIDSWWCRQKKGEYAIKKLDELLKIVEMSQIEDCPIDFDDNNSDLVIVDEKEQMRKKIKNCIQTIESTQKRMEKDNEKKKMMIRSDGIDKMGGMYNKKQIISKQEDKKIAQSEKYRNGLNIKLAPIDMRGEKKNNNKEG